MKVGETVCSRREPSHKRRALSARVGGAPQLAAPTAECRVVRGPNRQVRLICAPKYGADPYLEIQSVDMKIEIKAQASVPAPASELPVLLPPRLFAQRVSLGLVPTLYVCCLAHADGGGLPGVRRQRRRRVLWCPSSPHARPARRPVFYRACRDERQSRTLGAGSCIGCAGGMEMMKRQGRMVRSGEIMVFWITLLKVEVRTRACVLSVRVHPVCAGWAGLRVEPKEGGCSPSVSGRIRASAHRTTT